MDQALILAMQGTKQILRSQAISANNLANMSTTAFKADLPYIETKTVEGEGMESRNYSALMRPVIDFKEGGVEHTERPLDVAIKGQGLIAVVDDNGNEAYTRAGNLTLNATGQLYTATGYAVLGGGGGPISIPPAAQIDIASDGNIGIQPEGQSVEALAVVDRLKLVKPDMSELQKGTNGLFYLPEGQVAPADASVQVMAGALEGSNVSAVSEMTQMLANAREYEQLIKMVKELEDLDRSATGLLELQG